MTAKSIRFWSKVQKGKGCWEWLASRNRSGYGQFQVGNKNLRAHRVAWELTHGKSVPRGLCILHSCDNPPCVNPDHLFVGSQADNMADMVSKGRQRGAPGDCNGSRLHPERLKRGEESPNVRTTERDVRLIRRLYDSGNYTQNKLASMFDISQPTISQIVRKVTWSDC